MSFIHINPINLGRNLILLAIAIIEILFGFSIFNKVFSYFEADMENTYLQKQISTNLYYYSNIKNLALYDYNQIGVEGQSAHGENGTSRTWVDRNKYLEGVVAICTLV